MSFFKKIFGVSESEPTKQPEEKPRDVWEDLFEAFPIGYKFEHMGISFVVVGQQRFIRGFSCGRVHVPPMPGFINCAYRDRNLVLRTFKFEGTHIRVIWNEKIHRKS